MTLDVSLQHSFGAFGLDLAFEAPPGVTVLYGRSGAGKSSVVNAIAGLLHPDQGRITLDGQVLTDVAAGIATPPHRRRIGYVFQDGRLFPHLTVRSNLGYGRWFNRSKGDVDAVVALLGLEPLLGRQPATLSGGEKARVAIGRALLAAPRMLLMDEPLAALDDSRRAEVLPYLERLRDEVQVPILYVSHSLAEVARLATTLVLLDQGRVVQSGPVDALMADPTLASLFGGRDAGVLLSARVVAHHADGLTELASAAGTLWVPLVGAAVGSLVRLRILAQDVTLALQRPADISALNILSVSVTSLQEDGTAMVVGLQANGCTLLARITRRSAATLGLRPGTDCFAILKSMSQAAGGQAN